MAQETFTVDPNEDLDSLMTRLKQSRSKDVLIVLPSKPRALETLDNFNALRRMVREESINVTFTGGNKQTQGLAKLLGFQIDKSDGMLAGDDFAAEATMPAQFGDFGTASGTGGGGANRFGGPPAGFVTATNGAVDAAPPPMNPAAGNPFNNMAGFQPPTIPPRAGAPPPPSGSVGGAFGNGFLDDDVPLTRDNANSIFGGAPVGGTSPFNGATGGGASPFGGGGSPFGNTPPPPPPPESPFGGGGSGSRTMTLEEAQREGLLGGGGGGGGLGANFLEFNERENDDDDIPSVLAGDNAADNFRQRRGGKRDNAPTARVATLDDDEFATTPKPSRRRRSKDKNSRKAAAAAAVAGLDAVDKPPTVFRRVGTRIQRVLNPVQPIEGGVKMSPTTTPQEREQRRRDSGRFMRTAVIALLGLVVFIGAILWLLFSNSGSNNNNNNNTAVLPAGTARVTLGQATGTVTNTVNLALEPTTAPVTGASSTGSAGTTALTTPGASNTGSAPATSVGNGRLPVNEISTGDITKNSPAPYPAFGTKTVADGTARGTASVANGNFGALSYGAGQVVYTNPQTGVQYKAVTGATIPGGNGVTYGRGTVNVIASEAGSKGNMPARNITLNSAATMSLSEMNGGSEKPVKAVSPEDIQALQNQLVNAAKADAEKQVGTKYDPKTQGLLLLPSGDPKCSFSKQAGEIANDFTGSCTVALKGYVYSNEALSQAVSAQLAKNATSQQLVPGSIKFANDGKLQQQNGSLVYTVQASGTLYSPLTEANLQEIKQLVADKPWNEAQQAVLSRFGGAITVLNLNPEFNGSKLPGVNNIQLEPKYDYQVTQGTSTTAAPVTTGNAIPVPSPSPKP